MLASNPSPAALLIFTALFGVLWPFVGLYVRSTDHDLAAWPAVKICFTPALGGDRPLAADASGACGVGCGGTVRRQSSHLSRRCRWFPPC